MSQSEKERERERACVGGGGGDGRKIFSVKYLLSNGFKNIKMIRNNAFSNKLKSNQPKNFPKTERQEERKTKRNRIREREREMKTDNANIKLKSIYNKDKKLR